MDDLLGGTDGVKKRPSCKKPASAKGGGRKRAQKKPAAAGTQKAWKPGVL